MKISVFADDSRDPSLVGESTVDLEPALTKGEFDGECSACSRAES